MQKMSFESVTLDTLCTEPEATCVLCGLPAMFRQPVVGLEKDRNGRWVYLDPPPEMDVCERHSIGENGSDFSGLFARIFRGAESPPRRQLFGAEVPFVQEVTA